MNKTVFAKRLKEARTAQKLTQAQLYKKSGVAAATISAYESSDGNKGKKPSLENTLKLARALGVSLDWLCGLTENSTLGEMNTEVFLLTIMKVITDTHTIPLQSGVSCPMNEFINDFAKVDTIINSKLIDAESINDLLIKTLVDKYKNFSVSELYQTGGEP